ncbi:MAG: hypothetical protein RIC14_04370 [Filomicrobium sp.]
MFQAYKFQQCLKGFCSVAAVCAALLSFLFIITGPAVAQDVTIEPISQSHDDGEDHSSFDPFAASSDDGATSSETVFEGPEVGPEEQPEVSHQAVPVINDAPEGPELPANQQADVSSGDTAVPVDNPTAYEQSPTQQTAEDDSNIEIVPVAQSSEDDGQRLSKADKKDGETVKVAAVAPEKETSIFDRWSHSKHKNRKKKPPHPLAAMHPDDFVVVCEAGCAKEATHIVYIEPRNARGPVNKKPIKSGVVASSASGIDCVGGCYHRETSYESVDAMPYAAAYAEGGSDEGWMTTVKKAEAETPAEAAKPETTVKKRWYDRLN